MDCTYSVIVPFYTKKCEKCENMSEYSRKYGILQNMVYYKVITQDFQMNLNSKKVYGKGYLCVKSCARGDIPSILPK